MTDLTELGQLLHEEHFRILVSVCGLENRIRDKAANRPLNPAVPEDRELLEELMADLDNVLHHHVFEETVIFPLIEARGDATLAELLTEEHGIIEPMADRLRAVAAKILQGDVSCAQWPEFCQAAEALIAEVLRHLQTEETEIVARLATMLDPETDHQLAVEMAAERTCAPCTPASLTAEPSEPARVADAQAPATRPFEMIAVAAQNAARRRSTAPRLPMSVRAPSAKG
jgi:hemerythrin-like domain-containing protein